MGLKGLLTLARWYDDPGRVRVLSEAVELHALIDRVKAMLNLK
jgi:hypothetical protein